MNITDLLNPSSSKDMLNIAISVALSKFAVWIQDATLFLNNAQGDIPSPLLGFNYEIEGENELFNYQVTQYPFLNKQITSNGSIKQPNRIRIKILSVISRLNSYPVNFLKMQVLVPYIEKYHAKGGLFAIVTPFYVYRNCQLVRLTAVVENEAQKGVVYNAEFYQPLISTEDQQEIQLNKAAQQQQQGAVPL